MLKDTKHHVRLWFGLGDGKTGKQGVYTPFYSLLFFQTKSKLGVTGTANFHRGVKPSKGLDGKHLKIDRTFRNYYPSRPVVPKLRVITPKGIMSLFLWIMEGPTSAHRNGAEFSVSVLARTHARTASALWVHQPLLFIVSYEASCFL